MATDVYSRVTMIFMIQFFTDAISILEQIFNTIGFEAFFEMLRWSLPLSEEKGVIKLLNSKVFGYV